MGFLSFAPLRHISELKKTFFGNTKNTRKIGRKTLFSMIAYKYFSF